MRPIRFAVTLILFLALLCVPAEAQAHEPVSLTVLFAPDGTPAQGAEFDLYLVATLSADGTYQPTAAIRDLPLDFEVLSRQGLDSYAFTFESYVTAYGLVPDYTATADKNGAARFESLPRGVYLGVGKTALVGDTYYLSQSFLTPVESPVTVEPKYVPWQAAAEYSVVKVWEQDDPAARPQSVTVSLYREGEWCERVELTAQNNWRWQWNDLEPDSRYYVIEETPPSDYYVTLSREGTCFVVKNASRVPYTPPTQPTLPQTGVLWWPVPLCAAGGLLLILVGWLLGRKAA